MNNEELISLTVQVEVDDSLPEELDRMTRQLLRDLREMNVESADLVKSDIPIEGAKAVDPITIGAIALAVLPTVLPKIIEFLQQWTLRSAGRTVKFKGKVGGQDIEFEGSQEDLQKLLTTLGYKQ